jgi:hypothetical protein
MYDFPTHHYRANPAIASPVAMRSSQLLGVGLHPILKCYDRKTRETMAIRIVVNTRQLRSQARIEMVIVSSLNQKDLDGHSHLLKLIDTFPFRGHRCAVFDLLGMTFCEYLRPNHFRSPPITAVTQIAATESR